MSELSDLQEKVAQLEARLAAMEATGGEAANKADIPSRDDVEWVPPWVGFGDCPFGAQQIEVCVQNEDEEWVPGTMIVMGTPPVITP